MFVARTAASLALVGTLGYFSRVSVSYNANERRRNGRRKYRWLFPRFFASHSRCMRRPVKCHEMAEKYAKSRKRSGKRVAVFKYSMSTICIAISTAAVADIDHNDCVFIEEDQASCASTRFPVYSLPSGNTKRSDGRF